MTLSDYYDDISQCNRCGFCQVACPIFRSTGHESGVARGRIALLRALEEGRLDWSKELEGPLFNCLLCGACTANCFPAIDTADLVTRARSEYLTKVGKKPVHQLLFKNILPYPNRLHLAAKAVAIGKSTGLSDLARALGLLKIFGYDFSKAEKILKTVPARAFREINKPGTYKGSGPELRIGYFVGCGVDVISRDAGTATLDILKSISSSVTILDNCCCGLPAWSYGDLEATRFLVDKNLSVLSNDDYDLIATDCASCASFLKKYHKVFDEGDPRYLTAKSVSSKIKDVVELIAESPHPALLPGTKLIVTYHDPCHAVRGQGLVDEPRDYLKNLPGVEYRELPEADWCCGGGGSYAFSNFDLSREVLNRKMDNVEKTEADLLVTSCPACIIHLSYGLRMRGLKTKVIHISEVVNNPK